jgi:hypothetical protein
MLRVGSARGREDSPVSIRSRSAAGDRDVERGGGRKIDCEPSRTPRADISSRPGTRSPPADEVYGSLCHSPSTFEQLEGSDAFDRVRL